jgi:hypothetical protein
MPYCGAFAMACRSRSGRLASLSGGAAEAAEPPHGCRASSAKDRVQQLDRSRRIAGGPSGRRAGSGYSISKAIRSSRRRTPTARPEQARAGPGTRGARIWAKASAGTRRRLLAGSVDAGRTSALLLARGRALIVPTGEPCIRCGRASRRAGSRARGVVEATTTVRDTVRQAGVRSAFSRSPRVTAVGPARTSNARLVSPVRFGTAANAGANSSQLPR